MRSKSIFASLAAVTLGLLALAPTLACGPDKDAKKLCCPVVGLPESRTCKCPSGYCPLKPLEQNTVDFNGAKLQFCCGKCKEIFQKTPAKFVANANHQLVASGQAKQEKCPLCGGKTDLKQSATLGGVAVHFCTADCRDKAMNAEPADRVEMLFGGKAFASGFTLVKK